MLFDLKHNITLISRDVKIFTTQFSYLYPITLSNRDDTLPIVSLVPIISPSDEPQIFVYVLGTESSSTTLSTNIDDTDDDDDTELVVEVKHAEGRGARH